jgi:hypothetical protein
MRARPRWPSILFGILAVAFVAVNTANALNKGGDARDFFEGGRRALAREPLYAGSGPASGFIGPPFQALVFAPFAALDAVNRTAAKLLWYCANLGALAIGIVCCFRALEPLATGDGDVLRRMAFAWPAFVAVLFPLQTNFEHQNMNALLLGLLGAALLFLQTGRASAAGALVGAATALKAFPGLLIVYLAAAGFTGSAVAAILVAAVLSAMPVVLYGPEGFVDQFATWLNVSAGGWPVRGQNQSLLAAVHRLIGPAVDTGVATRADAPVAFGVYVFVGLGFLASVAYWFRRRPAGPLLYSQVAAVIALAVLLSPVAWDHYWVLMFPAFLFIHQRSRGAGVGPGVTIAFWTAAVLTSGISPALIGSAGLRLARDLSVNTLAAVILLVTLLIVIRRRARRSGDSGIQDSGIRGSDEGLGFRIGMRDSGSGIRD